MESDAPTDAQGILLLIPEKNSSRRPTTIRIIWGKIPDWKRVSDPGALCSFTWGMQHRCHEDSPALSASRALLLLSAEVFLLNLRRCTLEPEIQPTRSRLFIFTLGTANKKKHLQRNLSPVCEKCSNLLLNGTDTLVVLISLPTTGVQKR